jgi:cell division protein FtsQ
MVKKIFIIMVAVLLSLYLVFAIVYLNPKAENDVKCAHLSVEIINKSENQYLGEKEVINLLQRMNINPVGSMISTVNTENIEETLKKNRLIKQAECYKTINGSIKIKIYQRTPVLRVIANKGNYYVDNEGEIMPVPNNFSAYVPVATGYIEENFAKKQLYEFIQFLQGDKFWNYQIEQIYVAPNRDIELTPRVGNHQILLGKIENYPENLEKLKLFYQKAMNKVGWNKYSKINLKYKDQVICTKVE